MFYIKITAPVRLVHPVTGKPMRTTKTDDEGLPVLDAYGQPVTEPAELLTMATFVRDSICNHPKIGKGPELIARIVRLEMAFSENSLLKGTDGKYAAVESKDYEVARSIIDEMTWQTPLIGRQFAPVVEAWTKALDEQAWKTTMKLASVQSVG